MRCVRKVPLCESQVSDMMRKLCTRDLRMGIAEQFEADVAGKVLLESLERAVMAGKELFLILKSISPDTVDELRIYSHRF